MSYNKTFAEENPNPETFSNQLMQKVKEDINVMDLGIVVGDGENLYSGKGFQSKQIQLLRKKKLFNEKNELIDTKMPLLADVPTRGIANKGDIVIVLYANSDIRGALGLTNITQREYNHNINNAVAIGILDSQGV